MWIEFLNGPNFIQGVKPSFAHFFVLRGGSGGAECVHAAPDAH
jgi:hypothetical protein